MFAPQRRRIATATWFNRHMQERYLKRFSESDEPALELKDIDNRFLFLRRDRVVVDFGCYPGGWSAVAAKRCHAGATSKGIVIGVDRMEMDPIYGVTFIQGVIGEKDTLQCLQEKLAGRKADVVMSDMTPTLLGQSSLDHHRQSATSLVAAETAEEILKPGGTFVCRMSYGANVQQFQLFLRSRFKTVSSHVVRLHTQPDLATRAVVAYKSKRIYVIGEKFVGRHSLAEEVQIKGGFDQKEGRLGEATTDLLDQKTKKLRFI